MHAPTATVAALLAAALLASAGHAQTIWPEIEPNNTKAEALVNGAFPLEAGDGITGASTGSTVAGAGTANPDVFLIRTSLLPLGVYRHRLVLNSATAGHTATIRALNQVQATAGAWPCSIGLAGTTDSTAQTAQVVSGSRITQWYGFGRGEQLYYRVTGTTVTTADYTAILETEPVAIQDIGAWQTGQITISTVPPGHGNDVDLIVYDSNFNPIPGYSNDGASINGGHTANLNTAVHLRREYAPGTYYLAVSNFDLMNDLGSPCDDNRRSGLILDFPDAIVNSSATAPVHVHFNISDAWGNVQINGTKLSAFEVRWFRFTVDDVAPGGCCLPNSTCEIRTRAACLPLNGLYRGDGSDCFDPCPLPGACCLPNGTCTVLAAGVCAAVSGATFQGSETDCDACPAQTANQWFVRASAPDVRVGAAGAISGDTFYLIGGSPANGIRNLLCWKLDVLNNRWSPIADLPHSGAPAPQLGGISNMHAAVLDGSIYVVGGYSGVASYGALARTLRYDILFDYWEELFSDPYPTTIFAAGTVAHDGKLYVLGGYSAISTPTSACYRYDPAAPAGSRWTPIAPFDVPRAGVAAVVIGNKIYAVGGEATDQTRVDIYDILTDSWSLGPPLTTERGGTALYDWNGKPYAASGGWTTYITSTEVLEGGGWSSGPDVINGLRTMAFAGNSTWLVRSTGYDGAYRAYTETMRIAPVTPPCYANCDGSTTPPILNVEDFTCFINEFAAASQLPHAQQLAHYANCDQSTTPPVLNVEDFTCFINQFAQGCR
jgi:hypothetical protein